MNPGELCDNLTIAREEQRLHLSLAVLDAREISLKRYLVRNLAAGIEAEVFGMLSEPYFDLLEKAYGTADVLFQNAVRSDNGVYKPCPYKAVLEVLDAKMRMFLEVDGALEQDDRERLKEMVGVMATEGVPVGPLMVEIPNPDTQRGLRVIGISTGSIRHFGVQLSSRYKALVIVLRITTSPHISG